jgi:hypothetical protein
MKTKKLDFERMLKVYKLNQSRLPKKVKEEGKIGIMNMVNEICHEDFPIDVDGVRLNFHYVNLPNPFMKKIDDETLIKLCMIYGTFLDRDDDKLKLMFSEIEERGYTFVKKI